MIILIIVATPICLGIFFGIIVHYANKTNKYDS